ncbi:hypothetical protein TNCV_1919641 [Trichonephila clavipes]|nr:hypothetical protein TNCV_1919641 [Trichonephila clavipes]
MAPLWKKGSQIRQFIKSTFPLGLVERPQKNPLQPCVFVMRLESGSELSNRHRTLKIRESQIDISSEGRGRLLWPANEKGRGREPWKVRTRGEPRKKDISTVEDRRESHQNCLSVCPPIGGITPILVGLIPPFNRSEYYGIRHTAHACLRPT